MVPADLFLMNQLLVMDQNALLTALTHVTERLLKAAGDAARPISLKPNENDL